MLDQTKRITGIEFLGNVKLPSGTEFNGTILGGLSSIQYLPTEGIYYAISDDQTNYRYYTFDIDLSDGMLDEGDVTPIEVRFLTDTLGQPLANGSIDPEELTKIDNGTYLVTNEGFANGNVFQNPSILVFDSETDIQIGEIAFDSKFDADISGESGIRDNGATEAGTITPNQMTFYSGFENALLQDGTASTPETGSPSRIVEWDLSTGEAVAEYIYQNYPNPAQPNPANQFQVNGITALLSLDDTGTLLVLERNFAVGNEQTGTGHGGFLYEVSTTNATNVIQEDSLEGLSYTSVDKRFLLDLSTLIDAEGNQVVIDNVEGLTFGPELEDGRQSLFIVSDNNFSDRQSTQFMAFAVELEENVRVKPDLTFASYNTMLSSPADPEDGGAGDLEAPGNNPNGTSRDNLFNRLNGGRYEVAKNLAYVIQTERPDIMLVNEIDFDEIQVGKNTLSSAQVFNDQYLAVGQSGQSGIDYPYIYVFASNTGKPSGFDLNNDGIVGEIDPETGLIGGFAESEADAVDLRNNIEPRDQSPEVFQNLQGEFVPQPNDAFTFGRYEGQYSMAIYSMYPIIEEDIRTFQEFLWKDMPDNKLSQITPGVRPLYDPDRPFDPFDPKNPNTSFFTEEEYDILRLSSKNHIDIPVDVNGQIVHVLGSHPTPATYSSSPGLNEGRNFDEIRFWADYINGESYMYDDDGVFGGLEEGKSFIIAGDLNADPFDGAALPGAANQLLEHPLIIGSPIDESITPASLGGIQDDDSTPENPQFGNPAFDTVDYSLSEPGRGNVRVDYALPSSSGFELVEQEVIWPLNEDPLSNFVDYPTSDHKMVKIGLNFTDEPSEPEKDSSVRFMTFNSALSDRRTEEGQLIEILTEPDYELAQNDAAIIQYLRPEILVLQEFDYDANSQGITLFQENYLGVAQEKEGFELEPIEYEYVYVPTTNTGKLAPVDLNNDGEISLPGDGYAFGNFPGQYGMVILSQYEIDFENIRTFQEFLWKDMPGGYLQTNEGAETTIPLTEYYSEEAIEILRLSSKNHIDVPININGETIHVLASHPTPPVFDGEEKRNLKRNNDEIRFWADYIAGGDRDDYIYDDDGNFGGLEAGTQFVIMGDQNADPIDGDSDKGDPTQGRGAINQLLIEPSIYTDATPFGAGGVEVAYLNKETNPRVFNQQSNPGEDTSSFGLRADYVLPSDNLVVTGLGVFNPDSQDPYNRQEFLPKGTFETENASGGFDYKSSDHRAVFVDVDLDDSDDGEQIFKVNLFHQSDQEGFAAAPQDANRNGAVMNRLRSLNNDPSLFINSGDLWIAGLYLDASEAIFGLKGSGQVMINNYLNWQTTTWGNHEFDIPTNEVADAITVNSNLSIGLNNIFMPLAEEITTSAVGRTDNSFTVSEEDGETNRTLRIHGSINDLSSPLFYVTDFSSINLVNGADDNALVAPLEVNPTEDQLSAYFTGVITLTEDLQTALENGDLFVNVHTEENQDGEVKSVINLDRTYPGTYFPYLSSNIDFAEDPFLGLLQVEGMRKAKGLGNKTTTDPLYIDAGGETFAVVGATTPTMPSLASNSVANGGIVTPENWVANQQGYDDLAALIQEQVDRAIAGADGEIGTEDDVNKVIVATHMQRINIDIEELVPRLRNVDVYIAGGSNTIFQNPENPLYPGDDYQIEHYPLLLQGADGLPTAVVNTDMNHEYLGYLQLEFNGDGVIVNDFNGDGEYNFGTDNDFDISVSRAYPGDISQVEALNAENLYDSRIDNLATALSGQMNDKESRWYGISEEFLNGQRLGGGLDGVRNQETNLSNLIQDSYIWYSRFWDEDVVISMGNGSGIRASIGQILPDGTRTPNDANEAVGKPEGGISQADIESALAFNDSIALIDITGEELKTALESIDGLGSSDGDDVAYQIGGFAYSFDPNQSEGNRVRNARFLNEDGSLGDFIIQDGEVMTGDQVFRMATLSFNASRIFGFIENQNRVNLDPNDSQNETGGIVADKPDDLPNNAKDFGSGSQQDSLAEYLYEFSRMGTEDTADDVPLGTVDTTRENDERIQILSYREDSLATDEPPEPELPRIVFGSPDADEFDSAFPGNSKFEGQEQILFTGSGDDLIDVSQVGRGNRIYTGSGDDIVFAGNRNRISLGAGDDIIFAGFGRGANRISLGAGNDQFWVSVDDNDLPKNPNRVRDFNPSEDVIGFANTSLSLGSKGRDWNYEQMGDHVIISAFGQEIAELIDTSISDSNFVFA